MGRRTTIHQRGATLTGYALIISSMVVVSLGAIEVLDDESTELLEQTGDAIGEARPTSDELALLIDEEDPNDNGNGNGSGGNGGGGNPTPTYDWQPTYEGIVQSADGLCLVNSGGVPTTAPCSAGAGSFQFFDDGDDDTAQVQLRLDGMCVTRSGGNAQVVLAACQDGNENQMWLQTPSGNLVNGASPATAGSPGECLDIHGSDFGSPNARVLSYDCNGGPNQTFTFPGPYVPPFTEVTSVSASDATLTAPMQLAADGTIFAPDGTGRSLDAPDPSLGTATFTFTVAQAGQYKISGEVYPEYPTPGGNDSFWVTDSVTGADHMWGFSHNGGSLHSDFVNDNNGGDDVILDIPAGATVTLTVSVREDGAHLGSLTLVQIS